MTHPHDQAPAPLAAEVVSMVAQLRQRAIFAKAENTGTAQGDAWHFDGAADMLTALAAENATLRADAGKALQWAKEQHACADEYAAEVVALRASEVAALERVKVLTEALDGIYIYANDTLSGRVDGPDDREWQRAAVVELRNRSREFASVQGAVDARKRIAALTLTPTADKEPKT